MPAAAYLATTTPSVAPAPTVADLLWARSLVAGFPAEGLDQPVRQNVRIVSENEGVDGWLP